MADRTVSYVFRGNFTNLTAGLAAGGKSVKDFGDKLTALDKDGAKLRRGMDSLGSAAGKFGLVAAGGLGAAVLASANFDKAMSGVQAATHESAANMEALREAALKAGADTVFSATEAADAVTALAKAGVSTKDVLGGGLGGALALASAGELEVAQAAEIAATAMNQFGLAGADIPHIADLLAAAAGKAQGEVTDMANSLKYVGPVAAQMGISIEETTGAIAELASQGILGEQAGTSLRGMLTALTSPSKIAATTMKNLGISMYDATGQFIGLRGIAGQLKETMSGLSAAERDQALGRIFGNEQITAARILYAGGAQDVDKWTRAVNEQGYAAETASIKLDNLAGDLEALKGSLETALIGAGSGSQGPLRQAVQSLTTLVNGFNALPPAAQNAATGLTAVTAITGGSLWFGAKVIGGIADAKQTLADLGTTAPRTANALGKLGKAAQVAGIALAALTVVDAISAKTKNSIPGIQELTAELLSLKAAASLPEGIESRTEKRRFAPDRIVSLEQSIERLSDPNMAQRLQSNLAGALGGLGESSEVEIAREMVESLDAAFTNLVATAGADVATSSFTELTAKAGLSGDAIEDLRELMPGYRDALAGAESATDLAAAATDKFAVAQQKSRESSEEYAEALKKAREAATEAAEGFVNMGESLNDGKKSLGQWLKELEGQAKALRDFRINAEKAADKGLRQGFIAALQEMGTEGALRLKQLANATEAEIKRANKAWLSGQREIDRYVKATAGVPPEVVTRLKLTGQAAARAALVEIINLAKQIPRSIRTDYIVNQLNATNKDRRPAADGWAVPKTGLPYADRWPALLADGEQVISNRWGQADRFRADMAAGRIPRYSDGGTASRVYGPSQVSDSGRYMSQVSTSVNFPIDQIVSALLAARPLHGPVSISGDPTVYRRTLQRDGAMSSMDARRAATRGSR